MKCLCLGNNYNEIIEDLNKGGLVVFPFDTCYGLLADATNKEAIERIYKYKGKGINRALSVVVADLEMAKKFGKINNENTEVLQKLLPGPFTIIVWGKHKLAEGVEASDGSLGLRIPKYKPILELVKKFGKPVTATGANVFGKNVGYSIKSILGQLSDNKKEMVDLWIDSGELPKRQPSTVMDIRDNKIKTLRRGEIMMDKQGKGMISSSEEETEAIAKLIFGKISNFCSPIVFLLSGDLGTGKTVFARKIGKIMGVKETVTSPTFNIINEYLINSQKFLHLDLYRIKNEEELDELKFLDMFTKGTVACIEWPEIMGKKYLEKIDKKTKCIRVSLEYGDKPNIRRIWFKLGDN